MADLMLITCPAHSAPLIPSLTIPGDLACPERDCGTVIHITATDGLFPALTMLEQAATARHELVRAHEAAGFSRSEAIEFVIATVTANIMKDNGGGSP